MDTFMCMCIIGTSNSLPERPDKKSKDWRQQSEDFLSHVSQSIELRSIPEFIDFIKPGDNC